MLKRCINFITDICSKLSSSNMQASPLLLVRYKYIIYFILFCFFVILSKAGYIVYSRNYEDRVSTHEYIKRYNINDRNGYPIALDLSTTSIYLRPNDIRDHKKSIVALMDTFKFSAEKANNLVYADSPFVWVKRDVSEEEEIKLRYYGVLGIYFEENFKRYYPLGNLFSHIAGITDIDRKGLSGIEYSFNKQLQQRDIDTTLDIRIQSVLYHALQNAIENNKAKRAYGMVVHARTAEVLAMVSLPGFDPNTRDDMNAENMFNFNTQGLVEFGSVAKVFSAAIALDHGYHGIRDVYDVSKPLVIGSHLIVDSTYLDREIVFPEILMYSSNVGTSIIMREVGSQVQRKYLELLGLFAVTPLELAEKEAGFSPRRWSELTTVTASYGYGFSTSPATLLNAFSAVINDGIYKPFTLIKGKNDAKEGIRVLADSTSQKIRGILRLTVASGTGRFADAPGYNVGGKTGTAEKFENGAYQHNKMVTSFLSVFPAYDPKYIILMAVDEPQKTKHNRYALWGSYVVAPFVKEVVEKMSMALGIVKQNDNLKQLDTKNKDFIVSFVENMP